MEIYYRHFRSIGNVYENKASKGAITIALVEFSKEQNKIGYSFCSPDDNFSYSIGRRIAKEKLNSSIYSLRDDRHGQNFINALVEIISQTYNGNIKVAWFKKYIDWFFYNKKVDKNQIKGLAYTIQVESEMFLGRIR